MLTAKHRTLFESTKKLINRGALSNVKKIIDKTHSADLAIIFGFFDLRSRKILFSLFKDIRKAEVVSELDPYIYQEFLPRLDPKEVVPFVKLMKSDDAADLIGNLPEEYSQKLLELLKPREAEEVEELLKYGEQTAGGIMTPAFFALTEESAAGEAIKSLQNAKDVEMAFLQISHNIIDLFFIVFVICFPDSGELDNGLIERKIVAIQDVFLYDVFG